MLHSDVLRMVREALKFSDYEATLDGAHRVRADAEDMAERLNRIAAIVDSEAAQSDPTKTSEAPERQQLGQEVRRIWIEWAREQPAPKPSWLVPWEELSEADREVDRRIGERLFAMGAVSKWLTQIDQEENAKAIDAASKTSIRMGAAGMRSACAGMLRDLADRSAPMRRLALNEVAAAIEKLPLPPE